MFRILRSKSQNGIIKTMEKKPYKVGIRNGAAFVSVDKTIRVKIPTELEDLKEGDIVITAELMRVSEIRNGDYIEVTDLTKGNFGSNPYIKCIGWGQQGLLKVIEGVNIKEIK